MRGFRAAAFMIQRVVRRSPFPGGMRKIRL
jgi:hypothetical protein